MMRHNDSRRLEFFLFRIGLPAKSPAGNQDVKHLH